MSPPHFFSSCFLFILLRDLPRYKNFLRRERGWETSQAEAQGGRGGKPHGFATQIAMLDLHGIKLS